MTSHPRLRFQILSTLCALWMFGSDFNDIYISLPHTCNFPWSVPTFPQPPYLLKSYLFRWVHVCTHLHTQTSSHLIFSKIWVSNQHNNSSIAIFIPLLESWSAPAWPAIDFTTRNFTCTQASPSDRTGNTTILLSLTTHSFPCASHYDTATTNCPQLLDNVITTLCNDNHLDILINCHCTVIGMCSTVLDSAAYNLFSTRFFHQL